MSAASQWSVARRCMSRISSFTKLSSSSSSSSSSSLSASSSALKACSSLPLSTSFHTLPLARSPHSLFIPSITHSAHTLSSTRFRFSSSSSSSSSPSSSSSSSLTTAVLLGVTTAVSLFTLSHSSSSESALAESAKPKKPTTSIDSTPSSTNLSPSPSPSPDSELHNPGKFENLHRESNNVLQIPLFMGARFSMAQAWTPDGPAGAPPPMEPDEAASSSSSSSTSSSSSSSSPSSSLSSASLSGSEAFKQLASVGILNFGDPQNGTNGMLQLISQLGHTHQLMAVFDSTANLQGKYKYQHNPNFIFRTEFQAVPNNEMLQFFVDWKFKSCTYQLQLTNIAAEIVGSALWSLTPSMSFGVQLYTIPGSMTFVNYGARYADPESRTQLAASFKNGTITASCAVKLDQVLSVATDVRYNIMNHESVYQVGMHQRTEMVQYYGGINSALQVSMLVEKTLVPGVTFTTCGMVAQDGSYESLFGFGLSLG